MIGQRDCLMLCILISILAFSSGQNDMPLLVAGEHNCEGIVEVPVSNSAEQVGDGTLVACSRSFADKEAAVLCRQLGCTGGVRVDPTTFDNYTLPTDASLTTGLPYNCTGNEQQLQECGVASTICNVLNNNQEDLVAVRCEQVEATEVTELETTMETTTSSQAMLDISSLSLFLFLFVSLINNMS